jgi:hypothetical protein
MPAAVGDRRDTARRRTAADDQFVAQGKRDVYITTLVAAGNKKMLITRRFPACLPKETHRFVDYDPTQSECTSC